MCQESKGEGVCNETIVRHVGEFDTFLGSGRHALRGINVMARCRLKWGRARQIALHRTGPHAFTAAPRPATTARQTFFKPFAQFAATLWARAERLMARRRAM